MVADIVERDVIVRFADGPGKAGAGGGERLEAEMLQGLGAADVERVGYRETAALVHLAECGALVRCGDRHDSSLFFVLAWPRNDTDGRADTLVRVVNGAAVLWRLRAIVHAVIADHAGDAQAIVFENFRAALGLGLAVLGN